MSDEAKRAFKALYSCIDEDSTGFFEDFEKGYNQGRADAWRWISVSEKLPEVGQFVLLLGKHYIDANKLWSRPSLCEWDGNYFVPDSDDISGYELEVELVTLENARFWLPITLPENKI